MGMEKAEFQWFTRCFIMSRKWVFFVLGGRASTGRGSISTGNEQYVGSTGCWSLGIARLEQGRQRALLRSWSSEQTGKLLLQRLSGVYQRQIWGSTEMLRDLSQLPQAFLSPSTLCPGKGLGGLRVWQRAQKFCCYLGQLMSAGQSLSAVLSSAGASWVVFLRAFVKLVVL